MALWLGFSGAFLSSLFVMTLPADPATAAAALASPAALESLVAGVRAGARCRDGGAQVKKERGPLPFPGSCLENRLSFLTARSSHLQAAATTLVALADAVATASTVPPAAFPHLSALLSLPPSHPYRSARAAALCATAALATATARHDSALTATSILPAVAAGMADRAPEVREAAALAAGQVMQANNGSTAATLLPLLAPVLLVGAADEDAGVALAAVAGLGSAGGALPPCRAWQAWAQWGAASAALPCARPLVVVVARAVGCPAAPLQPASCLQPLLAARLTPRALWGLACLAGPAGLAQHASQVIGALDAAPQDDPALLFAAQAAGAALPQAALVAAAFPNERSAALAATTTAIRTCLLFGVVVAGHTLSAEEAPPVVAWLEGWWGEEEEEKEKDAAAWAVLQAAGLVARAVSDGARPAIGPRLWCVAVRVAAAVGGCGGGGGADAAVARLASDLGCGAGIGARVPAAWGVAAVVSLLSPTPSPPAIASLEAVLLAMARHALPPAAVSTILSWVEEHQLGLDPPCRGALLRLVGRVAASAGGAAALGAPGDAKENQSRQTLADRAATCIILPCLTQPKVGGGGVRAAAGVAVELIARLLTSGGVASCLASALAARATADADPAARVAACGGLAALLGAATPLSQAAREAGVAALVAALDDAGDGAGSARVRGAAAAAAGAVCAAQSEVAGAGG